MQQPQPPARPDTLHWLYGVSADRVRQLACATPHELQFLYTLSEDERCAYDLAIVRYLTDLHDDRWLATLMDMAVYYHDEAPDPNWKRGGPN